MNRKTRSVKRPSGLLKSPYDVKFEPPGSDSARVRRSERRKAAPHIVRVR
jgi:hypothetical protein